MRKPKEFEKNVETQVCFFFVLRKIGRNPLNLKCTEKINNEIWVKIYPKV